ncbi:DUF1349 domain-containing protein [Microbacterium dextranolyticum]|uniref:DUF1349 domain-containing protein n=1 Tax=Microbacterium dextranolyticum TaxID=36806 RepID=A0A9W6HL24_9MICO|nr:DUF1349 domain-containing protein [Microbacterium dextranolyticum]MBM7464157.1 regulation of enolase protein 1 (concanavalin A-like superfamily) [Microbacterium dextranolyticum]GLJ95152.1 hypothetical protein GCM10017591_12140 [Microbacterium dextranolyticum]
MAVQSSPVARIDWAEGRWTHAPAQSRLDTDGLHVTAAAGSDAWRHTSYGFVHDSEHALVAPLAVGTAMEVVFSADYAEQFDQAGLFVRADDERWVKAGVEFADGVLGAGAVVTDGRSDWSIGAVPDWVSHPLRVRVSRGADALTVRGGIDGGPLRLLRVAPFPGDLAAEAGPFVCAPTRPGFEVAFTQWWRTAPDAALH